MSAENLTEHDKLKGYRRGAADCISVHVKPNVEIGVLAMVKVGWRAGPHCGRGEVYCSRRKPLTWLDRTCGIFLLQLGRCRTCQLRHYRQVFFPAPEYPSQISARVRSTPSHANDEERRRSAARIASMQRTT
jgi:hypothetical protein